MTCFLTSSPFTPDDYDLSPANGFIEELKRRVPADCRALFVCSDPKCHARTDMFAQSIRGSFERAGFTFRDYRVLDGRNPDEAEVLIKTADLIILAGGHVPTQNSFFNEIGMRYIISGYKGVLVGISAGSMNSADTVYAHPELEGEAADGGYKRFLTGLNLTKLMILPHYQAIKDDVLDGLRVIEDIACPDSRGRRFYALVDGSYMLIEAGVTVLRGEAYLIADGTLTQICSEGETLTL